jgi:oxygen-independent coproporphyrinogen-3 oxidase
MLIIRVKRRGAAIAKPFDFARRSRYILHETMTTVSLYIHVPFCVKKCAYCDFNSVVYRHDIAQTYLAALDREMGMRRADFAPETIFIGGGTPTALSAEELRALLRIIRKHFAFDCLREFTVEANPATIDEAKAGILKDGGVNRISIGAQSFHAPLLKTLGRVHTGRDVHDTCALLRKAGFDSVSLDLIFSIPGETLEMWAADLREACDMGPEHISAYCLTYEPETPLGRDTLAGRIAPLPEELEAEMYVDAIDYLPSRGYAQYEISNFAKPGFECAHNIAYWLNRNSLGIGVGAFSYINGTRSSNARDIAEYVALTKSGSPKVFEETLDKENAAREAATLGLRTRGGLERGDFRRRTGVELDALINDEIKDLINQGFFEYDGKILRISKKGLPVTDSLLVHFMK